MPAYKDNNGKWYCSFYYSTLTGERKRKKKEGFKTQREAKAYERDYIERSRRDPDMPFEALVDVYLEDCKHRVRQTTLITRENIIRNHISPFFDGTSISAITPVMVREWQNKEIAAGYSQTYLKGLNSTFSFIMNFAVKYYGLRNNPVRLSGSIGRARTGNVNFWTLQEFNRFIGAVNDPQMKACFNLLFYSGMRVGELLALTLDDFNGNTVSISKTYKRLNRQDIVSLPKTEKSKREITLPPFIVKEIQQYALMLQDANGRLFEMYDHYIRRELDAAAERAGVKRIKIHDLRHSHASLLIQLGFQPLIISERLGHEKIETTLQTYSHLYPDQHGKVAEKLEQTYWYGNGTV